MLLFCLFSASNDKSEIYFFFKSLSFSLRFPAGEIYVLKAWETLNLENDFAIILPEIKAGWKQIIRMSAKNETIQP